MKKSVTYNTLQQIAEILAFKDNQTALASSFKNAHVDWDNIVRISSQHLMLPAIYCQLRAKSLLPYIPKDLELYLEELTAINRNRNEILITEAREISELFNTLKIDHVFIKGIALIGSNTFNDMGDRMIGDIDILVAPNQIDQAFDLLEVNGYTQKVAFNYTPKNYRHLARQVNPAKMGAVELHHEVLIHSYRQLIDKTALLERKQNIGDIFVPSHEDAIRIAILTAQINDKAHLFGSIKLKSIYDCLALGLQNNPELLKSLSHQKHGNSFLKLSSLHFSEFEPNQSYVYSRFLKSYYTFKLRHDAFGASCQKTLYLLDAFADRIKLFSSNKSYRIHVFKNKLNPQKK